MPIELPQQKPCVICEGLAGHLDEWAPIEETALTVSLIPEIQFEVGQSLIVPRRHAALLSDLTDEEAAAVMLASQRLMRAMVAAFEPLGIFVFQNNGVYSGQVTPHYHMHIVPRQVGSDWGVGPPHMTRFPEAGRTPHSPGLVETSKETESRINRARVSVERRRQTAARIISHLE